MRRNRRRGRAVARVTTYIGAMVDEPTPPPPDTQPAAPPPAPPPPPPPPTGAPPAPPAPGYAPPGYAPPGYGEVPPPPPPGYGTAGYGAPGYDYAPRTEGSAIAAFVVALVGLVVCGVVTGIIALVLANNAQKKIAASGGRLTGSGFVTAARIIAIISIVFSVLGIVFLITAS